jgi:hypothetical protein
MSNRILISGMLVLALGAFGRPSSAQAPDRSVSVMAGGFTYDFGGDRTSPLVGLRFDQRISRHLVAEVGASWALVDVDIVDYSAPDPTVSEGRSSLGSATVGLQAELPLERVRPYAGVSVGLFTRVDHPSGGDRFVRPMTAFPVGVRVPLGARALARAEARLRFDEHQSGGSAMDTELLVGLGWKF